jgi:drug/metabolite transporter (DMT)-like permease
LFNTLQYLAPVTSSPLNVTLVASSMPVWMRAVGTLFYGEHPAWRQRAGGALGLAGVLVVIAGAARRPRRRRRSSCRASCSSSWR